MRGNKLGLSRKLSVYGLGLVSLLPGCGIFNKNHAPTIAISEGDGTIVNPTNDLFEENRSCDEVYMLSLPRGNVSEGQLDLEIVASDADKNDILTTNVYPVNNEAFSVKVIRGYNSGNVQKFGIQIDPRQNISLGTYEIARATTSDGTYSTTSCIFMSTVPGTTIPPGEIPQIDNGNDNNNKPPAPGSDLENLATWACNHIPRPSGNDLALYMVNGTSNNYSYGSPVAELNPNSPEGGQLHYSFIIPQGSNAVIVEGNDSEGTYGEVFRIKSSSSNEKLRSSVGYTSNNCSHVVVVPYKTPDQIFTVMSEPQ